MALAPGARLGPYEIVAPLGAGGMGEVYRAHDTRLNRPVALKILHDLFADDPERQQRFEREAQALAALNHPHIAQIYGIEVRAAGAGDDSQALVMELVEGESLASRLTRGALPVSEALAVALQIADALEAAHDKNIVHRDLKPANVMLTPDGQVKVLDFGLAKIVERASTASAAHSPTLTFAATEAGVILGTAAYMSPEQAKGRVADKRSDIWSFGCVLFEMLTGRRAFDGEDVTETLAAVIRGEPDWSLLPRDTPPAIARMLQRTVVKDRKARIGDFAAVRYVLEEPGIVSPGNVEPVALAGQSRLWRRIAIVTLATIAIAALALASSLYRRLFQPGDVTRYVIAAPEGSQYLAGLRPAAAPVISPDGRRLAFTARRPDGVAELWIRNLDTFDAQPIAGTPNAMFPFWSPDSQSLAFFNERRLVRLDLNGGPPRTICEVLQGRGGTWGPNDTVVYGLQNGPLYRVAASGGEPVPVTKKTEAQADHRFPAFLPGGDHVLFFLNALQPEASGLFVASVATGEYQRVLTDRTSGIYSQGHLVFARQGVLMAQPFDVRTLTAAGAATPVGEQVESLVYTAVMSFSASDTGILAYGIGPQGSDVSGHIAVMDRTGKVIARLGAEGYIGVDLSPDGARLGTHVHDDGVVPRIRGDVWIFDISRGTPLKFTTGEAESGYPVWSPDGKWIAYSVADGPRGARSRIVRRLASGDGSEETLVDPQALLIAPTSWSADGATLLFSAGRADTGGNMNIWTVRVGSAQTAEPLLAGTFNEAHGVVSPDGNWIAYQSDETGQQQVYIRRFPSGTDKRVVSTAGGVRPRWRGDGTELFYLLPTSLTMVAVPVKATKEIFDFGAETRLFEIGSLSQTHAGHLAYAVSRDGSRFYVPAATERPATGAPIAIVQNWVSPLRK